MGHDAHHPIRRRLAKALLVALPEPIRAFDALPAAGDAADPLADETALRDWVLRHYVRYGLDPVWILTGRGASPARDDPPGTRLAPVFAMSPIDPESGRWQPTIVGRIALDETIMTQGRFVIRLEDRALEPRIRCGAYLVVDPAPDRLADIPTVTDPPSATGPVLAVAIPGEGLVVRFASREPGKNRLVLAGLDPAYPHLVMPWATAAERLVGRVVWMAQTL